MSFSPNRHEKELAARASMSEVHQHALAEMLADYRERLLRPFDEMRRDFEVLGDERVARELDDLVRAARGVS